MTTSTKKKSTPKKPATTDRITEARAAMEQTEKPHVVASELLMEIARTGRAPEEREKQFVCTVFDAKPYEFRHFLEVAQNRIETMRVAGTQTEFDRAQTEAEKRQSARDKYESETVGPLREQLAKAEAQLQKLEDESNNARSSLDRMQHARQALRARANLPAPMRAQAERLIERFESQGPPAKLRKIDERLRIIEQVLALPPLDELEFDSMARRRLDAYFSNLPPEHRWKSRESFRQTPKRDQRGNVIMALNMPHESEWNAHLNELNGERNELLKRREQVEAEEAEQRGKLNKAMNFWVDRIEEFIGEEGGGNA